MGAAGEFDHAAMLVHDVLGDGKAKAGAVHFAGDHGIENTFAQFVGDTGTVVLDLGAHRQAVALLSDGELALNTRAKTHGAFTVERLYRVARDVEYCLDELFGVGAELGNARVKVMFDPDIARDLGADQATHVIHDLVNIGRLDTQQRVRPDHAIY